MKSAFREYNKIDRQICGTYHEAAVKMHLPDSEFWILYALVTDEPIISQADLGKITGMGKTTVNSALKKMEREGVLKLIPGRGRNVCAAMTEKGKNLAEETVCRIVEIENKIYKSWSDEERAMMIRLNHDYANKLSSMVKAL